MERLKNAIKLFVPAPIWKWMRAKALARYCPVCGNGQDRFMPFETIPEETCFYCQSFTRHRLLWLFLQQRTNLFDGNPKKLLHIAPEPLFTQLLKNTPGIDYLSGDFAPGRAMVQMDLTQINYDANSFDVILCCHVLEHITEDRRAMAEMFRVLRPGGWAILQVPMTGDATTKEDPTITSPEARLKAYGQWDHVRYYGRDYADRLREAGFEVDIDRFASELPPRIIERLGLDITEDIYVCRKGRIREGDILLFGKLSH